MSRQSEYLLSNYKDYSRIPLQPRTH